MIGILLADDHPVVRAGLRALLTTEVDFAVIAEASTAEQAVEMARGLHPAIVLMDLQFPGGMQGAEATRVIRSRADAPPVLILTNYDTDADILAAVEAGAAGYLLKDSAPEALHAAIRAAARGESGLVPPRQAPAQAGPLSRRELEVLLLVADGLSNREIASALFLSEATVKSHLVRIFAKLGAASRTDAIARARAAGLIRG